MGFDLWWGRRHARGKGSSSGASQQIETQTLTEPHAGSLARPSSEIASDRVQYGLTKPAKTDKEKTGHDWKESWKWEAAAATLSVIGLGLLIGFLFKVHDTPYADWQYTASPNTVVSIIVTISKAALLVPVSGCLSQLKWNRYRDSVPLYDMQAIDQASRGPWGALELLWIGIPRLRMDALTLVGAFMTVLAVAIDPFSQQILAFPSHKVHVFNESALIQAAHRYVYQQKLYINHEHSGSLAPSMLSSMISGLAQTNSPLAPQCSSGICKFPEFITIGVCSYCEDITSKVNQICHQSEFLQDGEESAVQQPHVSCIYKPPSGLEIATDATGLTKEQDSNEVSLNHWGTYPQSRTSMTGVQKPIFSFVAANQSTRVWYVPENVTLPPPKPLFTDCVFYYCERKYASSHYLANDRASHSANVTQTQPLLPSDDTTLYRSDYVYILQPPDGQTALSGRSPYMIDAYTFLSIPSVMRKLFNTTTGSGAYWDDFDNESTGLNLEPILREADLRELLQSMSTSMTDVLRANPEAEKVPGRAFRVETYIHVRWPWIVLLVCAVLGSLVLLLRTATVSKRQHAKVWKASIIPLLTSRLDLQPENEIAALESLDDIHHMSKKTNVMINPDERQLVLTEQ
ncbi:hypothetical protein BDV38DRAFT_296282 [Aspergillus pseudotamarii]|uniref:Uncharacterized protein n=1 Tax=Aspergillus pseudotamarii TaxID=132259 RepID=A0A5N6T5U8_ASPPS|nr:uncharacterized protein BDV38DRAFT_296282 [Aspergillus pseudotamarii]KAE8141619.1 hypothetical protein BDV38DRAFT_296282 [Aspergillus pseudotamarii]